MSLQKISAGQMTVFDDAEKLAEGVASWLMDKAAGKTRFTVCLSGGSTPKKLFETLVKPDFLGRFPWSKTHWFWGDERFVPANHPDSNFHMTKLAMLDKAPIPDGNVHRIVTEIEDPDRAAAAYERQLKAFYGAESLDPGKPLFDVVFLGMGPDGHTASLLPGEPVLDERTKWVAAVSHGRPEVRITLTYPVLESARDIAFLIAGKDKAEMLAHIREGGEDVPAGRLRSNATGHWFVDRAAAGEI